MKKRNDLFLLALHKALNLTFIRYGKLKSYFEGNWESCWNAKDRDILAAGIEEKVVEKFRERQKLAEPEKIQKLLQKSEVQYVSLDDLDYPFPLSQIVNPPVVLFFKGRFFSSDIPSISVVGSRHLSPYGERAIDEIVGTLSRSGITIVSGFASGADTAAHKCALKNDARTIAVFGNGLDICYPSSNFRLAEKIIKEECGVLFSEYFPNTAPRPEYFPMRNRIISGLSKATLIIEAQEKSGSLVTAQLALEQNREVFALPGEIFAKQSRGTNALILNGEAVPALSGEQILSHLNLSQKSQNPSLFDPPSITPLEKAILDPFGFDTKVHINDLIQRSKISHDQVISTISLLEIKGILYNRGNQIYSKNV